MGTQRPLSTISYNSKEFLIMKLNELYQAHTINRWYFIEHKPEEDEKKNHFHVFMMPNKRVDMMELKEFFDESDPDHGKPRCCIAFHYSDLDEWMLYAIHYEPFLTYKHESRIYHYEAQEIEAFCELSLADDFHHALHCSRFAQQNQMLTTIKDYRFCPADLILDGHIPLSMASQVNALTYMQTHYRGTYRDGRPNHEQPEPATESDSTT